MAVALLGLHGKSQTFKFPLLMERADNVVHTDNSHIIDITSSTNASSNSSHDHTFSGIQQQQTEEQPSTSDVLPVYEPTFSTSRGGSNSQNSSFIRRANGQSRNRSPVNSGLWISVELVLTVSQIIAALIVLSLSRHEHPRTPLFVWIVGYASGCLAILPLLYWRYRHRNQPSERESSTSHHGTSQNDLSVGPSSIIGASEGGGHRASGSDSRGAMLNLRLRFLVVHLKMALDCFFAVWFVVGNVWIFGGHSSASEAPNLYRLCIIFLTFSCIGYAMPFILCATICCCLPCIISVLGFREDPTQSRGATTESINSLPTYKFKSKKNKSGNDKENNAGVVEGGIVAAGTEKERVISGEDAVCCICLGKVC